MSNTEVVPSDRAIRPDEVLGDWEPPDECEFCGAHWAQGPERDTWSKDLHCWRCGFRPGQNVGIGVPVPQQTFDYQRVAQLIRQAVTDALNSPAQKAAEELYASLGPEGMARLQEQEKARLQGAAPPYAAPAGAGADVPPPPPPADQPPGEGA